jgi:hypothetical protein
MRDKKNLLKVAKREETFSTLAHNEGLGAKARAKDTKGANRKDNQMEARLDEAFSKKRAKIAENAKRKAAKK